MKRKKQRKYLRMAAMVLILGMFSALCSACSAEQGLNFRKKSPVVLTFNHALRLKQDGTVLAGGDNQWKQCNVGNWKNIVSVAASDYHSVGLKSNGTVVAAGRNDFGECNVAEWKNIIDIAAVDGFTIGLKDNGTLIMTGNSVGLQKDQVSAWTDIAAVSAYSGEIACLKADGTVITASMTSDGKIEQLDWTDIVDVAVGTPHIVGLKADGTVVAYSEFSDLAECSVAEWKNIVNISAGLNATVGLKADGTFIACGKVISPTEDIGAENELFQIKDVSGISVSSASLMVLKRDGQVEIYGGSVWPTVKRPIGKEIAKLQDIKQ